ncbi:MAG: hypothetical protein Q4A27_03435 [bacterium]|nr:hypothetical protein [bacterium]
MLDFCKKKGGGLAVAGKCDIIISNMSQNKERKSRTYARNRTKLSRRGFEKNPEKDSIFLLKLLFSIFAGSLWLKFAHPLDLAGITLGALPLGLIIGLMAVSKFESRSENRKIFYAVIFVCAVISFFVPSGIVI